MKEWCLTTKMKELCSFEMTVTTSYHSITSPQTCIFSNTTMRTWNLPVHVTFVSWFRWTQDQLHPIDGGSIFGGYPGSRVRASQGHTSHLLWHDGMWAEVPWQFQTSWIRVDRQAGHLDQRKQGGWWVPTAVQHHVSSCDWTLLCHYQCLQIRTQLHTFNWLFQITNLTHNSFIFQQYVCYTTLLNMFRAARAHPQEDKLYHHSLWYRHPL